MTCVCGFKKKSECIKVFRTTNVLHVLFKTTFLAQQLHVCLGLDCGDKIHYMCLGVVIVYNIIIIIVLSFQKHILKLFNDKL